MITARDELEKRARDIDLLVLDVDGVLTDGGLWYGPEGEMFKRFDVKDGHGLVLARLCGLQAGILTARRSKVVEARARELGLSPVSQGNRDKRVGLFKLLEEANIQPSRVAYMGDDLNDRAPMRIAGLAIAPADAVTDILAEADIITDAPAGRGAARQVVELILRTQGKWEGAVEQYLEELAERDEVRRPSPATPDGR